MLVSRVEKHIIRKSNKYYPMLDSFLVCSKNLYNHANYIIRQSFTKEGKYISYNDMDKIMKEDKEYPDYDNMPTSQSAQQTLRLLNQNWQSFFSAIREYKKYPEKYKGRPKIPKYLNKNGRYELVLTNQYVKFWKSSRGKKADDGKIHFPKSFNGFTLSTHIRELQGYRGLQQVRILPRYDYIELEVVYDVWIEDFIKGDNGRYLGVDIGVDNLVTITNNFGFQPIIVNGKGLKSINKYYNKQISHYREIAKKMNNSDYTHRMSSITLKRNNKIIDYMHKVSHDLIQLAQEQDVSAIVIGKNKEWKQNSKMSKKVNQTFVQLPFVTLIKQIQYKAQNVGITVICTEESYTSGTSFLDNESPVKENYNKSRRVHRGLFKSNTGKLINADVNGSLQIIKKVFPNAFGYGIEGVAVHPIVVNMA